MASNDRTRWDERYAKPSAMVARKDADSFLIRHAPDPAPGARAVELACGLGQNAIWLAEHGYTVDAFDVSGYALREARRRMLKRGTIGVNFVHADLDHCPLPAYQYDLVVVFRFLDRSLFPAIRQRVRPGGTVIYHTVNVRNQRDHPSFSPEHMLALGELPDYFPGWTVLEFTENGRYSAFAGRKPASE